MKRAFDQCLINGMETGPLWEMEPGLTVPTVGLRPF